MKAKLIQTSKVLEYIQTTRRHRSVWYPLRCSQQVHKHKRWNSASLFPGGVGGLVVGIRDGTPNLKKFSGSQGLEIMKFKDLHENFSFWISWFYQAEPILWFLGDGILRPTYPTRLGGTWILRGKWVERLQFFFPWDSWVPLYLTKHSRELSSEILPVEVLCTLWALDSISQNIYIYTLYMYVLPIINVGCLGSITLNVTSIEV